MATYSSILPGEFHQQRSLASYSPWESQRVGHTHTHTQEITNNGNHELFCLKKNFFFLLETPLAT